MSDRTTEMMLAAWTKHRGEGQAHGYDRADGWQSPPEYAVIAATRWARQDEGWRVLIGARLASDAIQDWEASHA
jgi:hypothetical protein